MVMVVRAAPDAAGTQGEDAENAHQDLRQKRLGENGMVLLVMINHEKPEDQQAGKDAAEQPCAEGVVPQRAGQGRRQKSDGGKDIPPAPSRVIVGEGLGSLDQFLPGARWRIQLALKLRENNANVEEQCHRTPAIVVASLLGRAVP